MRRSLSSRSSARRFFRGGYTLRAIAASPASYDAARAAPEVRASMALDPLGVAGLRLDGYVVGYVFGAERGGIVTRSGLGKPPVRTRPRAEGRES